MAEQVYYNGNTNLRGCGGVTEYTREEFDDFMKCQLDPVHFIKTHCKIISLDHGLVPFNLYDYQVNFINEIHNNRKVISMQPRQMGKCFSKDTKYKIRNKKTQEILYVTAEEFHNMQKQAV